MRIGMKFHIVTIDASISGSNRDRLISDINMNKYSQRRTVRVIEIIESILSEIAVLHGQSPALHESGLSIDSLRYAKTAENRSGATIRKGLCNHLEQPVVTPFHEKTARYHT